MFTQKKSKRVSHSPPCFTSILLYKRTAVNTLVAVYVFVYIKYIYIIYCYIYLYYITTYMCLKIITVLSVLALYS